MMPLSATIDRTVTTTGYMPETERDAHSRAGLVMYHLCLRRRLTTRQIMTMTGLTRQGVEYLMNNLSILPVGLACIDGYWQLIDWPT